MNDEFERRIARSLRSAGSSVAPSPTGYLRIRDEIETRAKRVRRVARVAISSMSVVVVTVIGFLVATGGSGTRPVETAMPEESGIPGYSPAEVPAGMQVVQVVNHAPPGVAASDHFEVYRSPDTDSRIVVRRRGAVSPSAASIPSIASGPLLAEIMSGDDGSRVLRWLSSSGTEHEVSGWGVSDEELRLLANDIEVRIGLPSSLPIELPVNMALVAQGELALLDNAADFKQFTLESQEGSERDVSIEVTIHSGNILALEVLDASSLDAEWVGEAKLLVHEPDDVLVVLWAPSDDLLVETRSEGLSVPEVLEFVDLLRQVEEAEWSGLLPDPLEPGTTATTVVSVGLAEAAGQLDGHSWRLLWPTDVGEAAPQEEPDELEQPEDEPDELEQPVSAPAADADSSESVLEDTAGESSEDLGEPVEAEDISTVTTQPAQNANGLPTDADDGTQAEQTDGGVDPVVEPDVSEVEPSDETPEQIQPLSDPESCLRLLVDANLVGERCDTGLTTRVRAIPALDRILLVAYNPLGDLWLGNSLVVVTDQGAVDVVPDATARGYVWLAWLDAEEIMSVSQVQLDGTVHEFSLVAQDYTPQLDGAR